MPKRTADREGYDAFREQQAEIAAVRSAKGREIGSIPDIANVRRRSRCRKSLRAFCETYNPRAFYLGWSAFHRRAIERIEEAATLGALYALAFPRGSGKTTLCRMAALWVVANSLRRYAFIIGANDAKAADTLTSLRTLIRFSPEFAADYPEVSYPAQHLKGIGQRAVGQTCDGESTLIEWAGDRVVLATVPPPANWPRAWELRDDGKVPTSGSVFSASGLTGEGIRGSLLTLSTGGMIRPDFVLLDDPQTNESANSPTQNATRETLVSADVLGMAGPDRTIAAVMPCTVIAEGDFVDRVLDPDVHPLWRGERVGLLSAMPKDMPAWERYFEVYRECGRRQPPDFTAANEHYRANRAVLDEGATATWPDRRQAGEVSAVQSAMNLYFRNPRAFWAEYMNRPLAALAATGSKSLDARRVAARLNGSPRAEAPPGVNRVTVGIDVGGDLLWFAVVGWNERFGGAVLDYGCWPRQARSVFAAADARPGLKDAFPGHTEEQRVYAGLAELVPAVLGRGHPSAGGELRAERCLIDAGWKPDAVYQFAAASPHAGVIYPSKGVGRSTTQVGVARWKPRPGERTGHHWRLTLGTGGGRGRQVQFDPDAWKSFLHAALTVPVGGPLGLTLFGKDGQRPADHELLAEHCAAEYSEPATLKGDTFDKWQVRPHRTDNHLWDCLALAAVAASVQGLTWRADGEAGPPPKPAGGPKKKLSDIQREKLSNRG